MVRFNRLAAVTLVSGALMVPLLGVPTAQAADILPCNTSRPYRDLNGDGFEDAVVGDPYATVDGKAQAGTVTVLFGEDDLQMFQPTRASNSYARLLVLSLDQPNRPGTVAMFSTAVRCGKRPPRWLT